MENIGWPSTIRKQIFLQQRRCGRVMKHIYVILPVEPKTFVVLEFMRSVEEDGEKLQGGC